MLRRFENVEIAAFDQELEYVLNKYTAPSSHGQEIFCSHREIGIARLAIEKQAQSYSSAVATLTALMQQQMSNPDENAAASNTMMLLSAIESKSEKLIQSAKKVIELLATAATLDIDKAALHAVLIALPSLTREVILDAIGDTEQAEIAEKHLTDKINKLVNEHKFSPDKHQNSGTQGITYEEYETLYNSVPTADYSVSS